jgi:hypothetical protein
MRQITCYISVLTSLCVFVFVLPVVAAQPDTITVSATVLPAKYVYVNDKMRITKIVSNTPNDAPIIPLSNSLPTQKVPLTPEISQQYAQISKQVNLLKYGQVYPLPKVSTRHKNRMVSMLAQIFRPFQMCFRI